ncbi:hypothetical protein D3C71_1878100 [compost metagenome]
MPQRLPKPVRLTRAIACSNSASRIGRSRYITPSIGASKPVSSIDLTIRKASGSVFSGLAWNSGFLKPLISCSCAAPSVHCFQAGSSLLLPEMIGANSMRSRVPR